MGAKQLVHHEDFLSANIDIRLRNLVTDTVIDSRTKTIKDIPIGRASDTNLIQLLEILADGLVISVPRYTCAVGHNLEIEFDVVNLSEHPFNIQLLGRVKSVEKTLSDQVRTTIELKNTSDVAWKDLCRRFSDKQEAIHKFFTNVRGY